MKYRQIRKKGRVPFGYKVNEFDPKLLDPIEKELDLLEQALRYMRTCSLREVHRWLVTKSGRKLSVMGLWTIQKKQKDTKKATYFENSKRSAARRKLDEADREQRRIQAEAKATQAVPSRPEGSS